MILIIQTLCASEKYIYKVCITFWRVLKGSFVYFSATPFPPPLFYCFVLQYPHFVYLITTTKNGVLNLRVCEVGTAERSLTANQKLPGSIPGLDRLLNFQLGDLLSPDRPWTGTSRRSIGALNKRAHTCTLVDKSRPMPVYWIVTSSGLQALNKSLSAVISIYRFDLNESIYQTNESVSRPYAWGKFSNESNIVMIMV